MTVVLVEIAVRKAQYGCMCTGTPGLWKPACCSLNSIQTEDFLFVAVSVYLWPSLFYEHPSSHCGDPAASPEQMIVGGAWKVISQIHSPSLQQAAAEIFSESVLVAHMWAPVHLLYENRLFFRAVWGSGGGSVCDKWSVPILTLLSLSLM